jgi:hypothetical protein
MMIQSKVKKIRTFGDTAIGQNTRLMKWQVSKMVIWQNGKLIISKVGETVIGQKSSWWNGKLVKWWFNQMSKRLGALVTLQLVKILGKMANQ